MTDDDIPAIVAGLNRFEADFLTRVCDGAKLPLACRVEDRARQKLRRMGLIEVVKNPRRWVATDDGLRVRQYLTPGEYSK